jgi:hypothetical protein
MVFQQWGKCGKLLNSGVSAMGKMWKIVEQGCFMGKMFVEQWCFKWGKCGKLLNSGVSAMGKLGSS